MVPGLISSVLDTWRVHCAVLAPESGLSGGPGWGGALEGAWTLSWTGACAANASSRLIMRAGASSSGMKSALREAVTVDGWTPRRFRPPLPRRPGLDQPRLPPTTLEDCPTSPRKTRTTCGNTRELMNKHPALVLRSIRFRPTLSISTGRCARCPSVLCAADACGGGAAVVPAIGDRLYRRALRQQGCEWLGHPLERRPGIFDAARSIARRGGPSRRRRTLLHGVSDGPDGSAAAPRITIE